MSSRAGSLGQGNIDATDASTTDAATTTYHDGVAVVTGVVVDVKPIVVSTTSNAEHFQEAFSGKDQDTGKSASTDLKIVKADVAATDFGEDNQEKDTKYANASAAEAEADSQGKDIEDSDAALLDTKREEPDAVPGWRWWHCRTKSGGCCDRCEMALTRLEPPNDSFMRSILPVPGKELWIRVTNRVAAIVLAGGTAIMADCWIVNHPSSVDGLMAILCFAALIVLNSVRYEVITHTSDSIRRRAALLIGICYFVILWVCQDYVESRRRGT